MIVTLGARLDIEGELRNSGAGAIQSVGILSLRGGTLVNSAGSTLQTTNQLEILSGAILQNAGTMTNGTPPPANIARITVSPGRFENSGLFTNFGSGEVLSDDGHIVNSNHIVNDGTILSRCGTFTNTGTVIGNPVREALCWTGAGSTAWSTAANWNFNRVPASGDEIVIRGVTPGPVLDADFTLTGSLTISSSNLTIAPGVSFTNQGNVTLSSAGRPPGSSTITNDGTFTNNAVIQNGDLVINNGTFTNNATVEQFVGQASIQNAGILANGPSASWGPGGLTNLAGGELRNSGVILLNRSLNENAGAVVNLAGATFTLNNALVNRAGGVIENGGQLTVNDVLTFPGRLDNDAGATILNAQGGVLSITGAEAALNNAGTVRNAGTIANGGVVTNSGLLCGGVITGNPVSGDSWLSSCDPSVTIAAPPDIEAGTAPGACVAAVNAGVATTTGSGVTVVGVRDDGLALSAPYPAGVTEITWTATDATGGTATAAQRITVADREPPSLGTPADVAVGTDPGEPTAIVGLTTPPVSDNRPGAVQVSPVRSDGLPPSAPYPLGITTITWHAGDASGNAAAVSQRIEVQDREAPSLTVPPDITIPATGPSGADVGYVATASDNVGVATLECTPTSGSTFAVGTTVVSCTAADLAGNATTGTFQVLVLGAEDQLTDLMATVAALDLPRGATTSLQAKLRAALEAVNAGDAGTACAELEDFIRMARHNRMVATEVGARLADDATRIRAVLGC